MKWYFIAVGVALVGLCASVAYKDYLDHELKMETLRHQTCLEHK